MNKILLINDENKKFDELMKENNDMSGEVSPVQNDEYENYNNNTPTNYNLYQTQPINNTYQMISQNKGPLHSISG